MDAIKIEGLSKVYKSDFLRKSFAALQNLNLTVQEGIIFGFIGPNGAGKTTTIKILTGLIFPTSGRAEIFGRDWQDVSVRGEIGFLPELPSFYEYLTGRELMHFYGQLLGLSKNDRRQRTEKLLETVGLADAANRQVRKYSKGMMQRLGLAQALLNDPKLVILDEPMSGLDPVGRREVRDIILELREQGKTVFFSTHILSDVEMICDEIAILHKGRLLGQGTVSALLAGKAKTSFDFEVENLSAQAANGIAGRVSSFRQAAGRSFFTVSEEKEVDNLIKFIQENGGKIRAIYPNRRTLEDIFMELVRE